MEVYCSFKKIVGGICGYDNRDRKRQAEIVSLSSCKKDIAKHLTLFSFSGPENEMDLILCPAGIFQKEESLNTMTISASHRGKLGLGWTRCSTRCRIPAALSNHGEGGRKAWPKGDRGIGKRDSETVLHMTGVFIQAGSGKILYDLQVILMLIVFWHTRFLDVPISICMVS